MSFNNQEIQISTREILIKVFCESADSKELIKWAVQKLEKDVDSEPIRILAGLTDNTQTYETVHWFKKSLDSIDFDYSVPQKIVNEYTDSLAIDIIKGDIAPLGGLKKISELRNLIWDSDYDTEIDLHNFMEIEDAIGLRDIGDESYVYLCPEMESENVEKIITDECKLFLKLKSITLPEDFYMTAYCDNCKVWMKPLHIDLAKGILKFAFVRRLLRKPRIYENKCSHCNSEELVYASSIEGRKRYLKEKGIAL